jgi:uncharacterized protein
VSVTGAPAAFHLLAKPTGAVCNLDCTYCFFLSKEALYPGSPFRMDDTTLEAYIRQLIEAHRTPEVTIAWQGGEPTLMGIDFYRRAAELAERYRKPGQRVQHTMQTNGVLVDDEWAALFKEHAFLIGLSVDGPKEMHDGQGGAGDHADLRDRRRQARPQRPLHLREREEVEALSWRADRFDSASGIRVRGDTH